MGTSGKRETTHEGEEASMDGFEALMAVPVCILSTWGEPILITPEGEFWELGEFPFLTMDETEGFQYLGH